jgi:hypothetical protein
MGKDFQKMSKGQTLLCVMRHSAQDMRHEAGYAINMYCGMLYDKCAIKKFVQKKRTEILEINVLSDFMSSQW